MHHHICAVLNGADQIRGAEGVVDHQRQAVAVCDLGNGVNIRNIAVGVAQRFNIHCLGVGLNGVFHLGQIMRIHKSGLNAVQRQRVLQQVAGAAVNGFLRHDMLACLGQCLNGIGDGGCARGHGQTGHAALQSGNAILKHALCRVGQAAVDIACIGQAKAVGCVLAVAEHIAGGGVNGHSACIAGGVRRFLAHMKLQGLKFIVRHNHFLFSIGSECVWFGQKVFSPKRSHSPKSKIAAQQLKEIMVHTNASLS